MAIVYYPRDAQVYVRTPVGAAMTGLYIDVAPNQIIILSGSGVTSASTDFVTASYALTYLVSMSRSDLADTASVALNGGISIIESRMFL